jgi:Mrp family chromosome partitioning ATPase
MPTEADLINALKTVMDPELGRSVVDLQMVRDIKIEGGKVSFTLALTIPSCPLRETLQKNAYEAVIKVPGVTAVEVNLSAMTDEERQVVFGKAKPSLPKINQFNKVENMIAIMSGKGGVGKSSVTSLLAVALANRCQRVGILDADITGPSIPKLFGLTTGGVRGGEQGLLPPITGLGIKIMSINLLVEDENAAVIWRGPMISGAITQFWTDVLWGKLDYLLVDLPPGTSDASLTVMQSLPISDVLLVTTPQQLSAMVVRKAVSMLNQMNIPAMGVVENMSYYKCPDTGKNHEIFGPSHAETVAAACRAPVLARLPIDPQITALGDAGQIEKAKLPEVEALVDQLLKK